MKSFKDIVKWLKESIKFLWDWFLSLSFWKRMALSYLFTAIGGSSFMGFLNKYGLYYYAYSNQIRIPIEGVEYLDLAVSFITFLIISIVSSIAFILHYSVKLSVLALDWDAKVNPKKKILFSPGGLWMIAVMLIAMGTPMLIDSFFEIHYMLSSLISISIAIVLGILLFLYVRGFKNIGLIITSLICSLIMCSFIFNQKIYSLFLNSIRYGGMIPVHLEYRQADNTSAFTGGKLILRTTETVSIISEETGFIEEIPNDRVSKIVFKDKIGGILQ